jgi:pectate lyase
LAALRGSGLDAVRTFADHVLRDGRDRWGAEPTPLFADGLDCARREPVRWTYRGRQYPAGSWVVSDLALQQHLCRTLVGLSSLTGEARYRDAAAAAVAHHLDHLASPCGLLRWGGHQFVDLCTKTPQGPCMGDCHEFKHTYPFYELMAEVRPAATARFVRALWNAHLSDWSRLDLSRHGPYGKPAGAGWQSPFAAPPPFFAGDGLSFINCGSDLIFAAASLHRLLSEPAALLWAKRLDGMYVRARDPHTGLGVYQYSCPRVRAEPVAGSTLSLYGDRAQRQLGPEWGEAALEGNVLEPRRAEAIYGHHALIQLFLAEELADPDFLEPALAGLRACARWLYDAEAHRLRPRLADGRDLSGWMFPRDGYYGPAGSTFQPRAPGPVLFWSFALGFRLSGDAGLWPTVRALARGLGLGDLGPRPGDGLRLPAEITGAEPYALFAALELYAATGHPGYGALAEAIGAAILGTCWHEGYFLPGPGYAFARFDAIEPLALLALEAMRRGTPGAVPRCRGGRGFLQGHVDDGPRVTDAQLFWQRRRGQGAPGH